MWTDTIRLEMHTKPIMQLRFSVFHMPPYTLVDGKEGDPNLSLSGPFIKIMYYLAESLRVEYRVYVPKEPEHGFLLPDGNWTGILGSFIRNESDMALVPFAPNSQRFLAADFSSAFWFSEFTILSGKPRSFSKDAHIYFSTFDIPVWLGVALAFLLSSSVSYLSHLVQNSHDRGKAKRDFTKHLLYHFGPLVKQGFSLVHNTVSGRLMSMMWLDLVLVFTTCFSGSLRIRLTFKGDPERVDSLSDIFKYPTLIPVIGRGTIVARFLQESQTRIWDRVSSMRGEVFHKELFSKTHLDSVFYGREVILTDRNSLEYAVGLACSSERQYHFAKEPIFQIPIGLAFRKELPIALVNSLNQKLLRYADSGHAEKVMSQSVKSAERCNQLYLETESDRPFYLSDLLPVFLLLGLGLFCSAVAGISEVLVFKKKAFLCDPEESAHVCWDNKYRK